MNDIVLLFKNTVKRFAKKIAISEDGLELNYEMLEIASNNLASKIISTNIKCNEVVGIFLNSSIEYVITILGILKACCIFYPINPRLSDAQIIENLNFIDPKLVITNKKFLCQYEKRIEKILKRFGEDKLLEIDKENYLNNNVNYYNLEKFYYDTYLKYDQCYLLSTSGSTGDPKIICGSKKGLNHFIEWEIREFNLNENTRASFLSHPTFDVSLRDIFVPLCSGGVLFVPDEKTKNDPAELYRWFERNEISLTHIVPTLFRLLTQVAQSFKTQQTKLSALEWVLLAGEPLFGHDVLQWNQVIGEHAKLVNIYGPSETTLAKIFNRIQISKIKAQQIVPLGKPIEGARVMVIDGNRLCNIGEEGQICIETKYRSKGYYKNPELTRSVFVPNPIDHGDHEPVYLTGDIGKWLEDGTLQFLGRKDAQIKLHGKRVELNEIENALTQHPEIQMAAVALKLDEQGNQRLVAYIVSKGDSGLTVEAIRRFLLERIPDYMVPGIYVFSKDLPLTNSGKIDRRSLPDPEMDRPRLEQGFVDASNDIETILVEVWRQVLGFQKIGIDDNFFDLGGNSILAARLAVLIGERFSRELPVVRVFEYPSIRVFANFLRKEESGPIRLENHDHRAQQRHSSRIIQRRTRPMK
jgi:amino acid adenylation domain-containing protein